jgi:hypothetical protein
VFPVRYKHYPHIETVKLPAVTRRAVTWDGGILRIPHSVHNRLTDDDAGVSLPRQPTSLYLPGIFLLLISVRGSVNRRRILHLALIPTDRPPLVGEF